MKWTESNVARVKDEHEAWIMRQPGVVGVGLGLLGDAGVSIQIMSDGLALETRRAIEQRLAGAPVHFVETGPVEAQ